MRRAHRSVRQRIVLTTGVLTLVGMIVVVSVLALVQRALVDTTIDKILADRAAAVVSTLDVEGSRLVVRGAQDDALDRYAWIMDSAGHRIEGGAPPAPVSTTVGALSSSAAPRTVEVDDWRVHAEPVLLGPGGSSAGVVVVAEPLEPYETTQRSTFLATAGLALAVTVGVTALAAWTVRRALAPVSTMARSAAEWSAEDLTRRFDLGPAHDEITQLAEVLDTLLDRVSSTILAEQRLTSELAHELRSPLTVVRAEAELGSTDPDLPDVHVDSLRRIIVSVDHLTEVIDTLLSVARGTVRGREDAAVDDLVATAVAASVGAAGTVPVLSEPSHLSVAVPGPLAARALAPLLANARAQARTSVTVRSRSRGRVVDLEVIDDGPGVGEADRETVFDAGTRGPESPGAGLGLPLARRVARSVGGDVTLRPGVPTTFVLTLPAARLRRDDDQPAG